MASHSCHPLTLLLIACALSSVPATPASALTPGQRSLASAPRVLIGDEPGEGFGASVASPGDVTGDGIADLLVGAPNAREGAGRVYLFSGADILDRRALRPTDAWAVLEGETGWAYGSEVAGLGDVDGDGWPDWGVGAPNFPGGDAPPGRLWIVPGALTVGDAPLEEALRSDALAALDGPNPSAVMGQGFVGIGDANGDGLDDFAVVHRDQDTGADAGFVHVVLGRARANWPGVGDLSSVSAWSWAVEGLGDPDLGFDLRDLVVPAGDADGDGLGDLWLGLPGADGAATRSGALMLLPGLGQGAPLADGAAVALFSLVADTGLLGGTDVVDAHLGQPLALQDGMLWAGAEGPERGVALGLPVNGASLDVAARVTLRSPAGVAGGPSVVTADLGGTGRSWTVVGTPRREEAPGRAGSGRVTVLTTASGEVDLDDSFAAFDGDEEAEAGVILVAANFDGGPYDDVLVGAPGAFGMGAVYLLAGEEMADGDGIAPIEGDCDDSAGTVFPGALEITACDDNLDNDCNGLADEADAPCAVEGSGLVTGCSTGAAGASWIAVLLVGLFALARRRRLLPVAALLLAGCTSGTEDDGAPTITITSPDPDERIPDTSLLAVSVAVTGARLAAELNGQAVDEPAADEPQVPTPVTWALSVDGFFRGSDGGPLQVADGMVPGVHNVEVELLTTDGQSFDPPVTDSLSVEIVAGVPTLVVTSPTENGVVPPEGFDVLYDVGGFLLNSASIGGANQLGVGHARVFVDDVLAATDTDGRAFVTNVDPGEHDLAVELVNNDGTPLSPAVRQEVAITVAEPSITILAPGANQTVTGPSVTLEYETESFTLDPVNINGAPESGRGHTHIYLDGLYQGLDATGTVNLPNVVGCSHTIRLELALAGHQELGISEEVTFSLEPCIAIETLQDGDTVTGPQVVVPFATPGHVLDNTPPDAGGRYVTMYLDGTYVGFEDSPGNATFTGVSSGDHVFELRLAEGPVSPGNEQSGEFLPLVVQTLSLTVQ